MKKHKHHDVIVGFAQGKTIQLLKKDGTWIDWTAELCPEFRVTAEYRIKPEPEIVLLRYTGKSTLNGTTLCLYFNGHEGVKPTHSIKLMDGILEEIKKLENFSL